MRLLLALVALPAFAAGPARAQDAGLSLFVIPTEVVGVARANIPPLHADFYFNNTQRAADYIAGDSDVPILDVTDDYIRLDTRGRRVLRGDPSPQHTAASFVIDYDQPAVAALQASLPQADAERRPVSAITRIVDEHISNKSYLRGFDFASTTARSREGDCTEHAVLHTALARAEGYPSRVAFGIMLLNAGGGVTAYSHAWSEVFDAGRWQLSDATLPSAGMDPQQVLHIPLTGLHDEGTGYSFGMLHLNLLIPSKIRLVYPD